MFKIDNNVPPPSSRRYVYPLADMHVGDSFFVPANEEGAGHLQRKITSAAYLRGKRRNIKFCTKIVTEAGQRGVRCWRVE